MRTLALFLLAVALVTTSASAASPRAKVLVRVTSVGGVLVDARGHTLYSYAADQGRTPACYGACASLWPPFLTSAKPIAGLGAKATEPGRRASRKAQRRAGRRPRPARSGASAHCAG